MGQGEAEQDQDTNMACYASTFGGLDPGIRSSQGYGRRNQLDLGSGRVSWEGDTIGELDERQSDPDA